MLRSPVESNVRRKPIGCGARGGGGRRAFTDDSQVWRGDLAATLLFRPPNVRNSQSSGRG
jgi:hypothetical protein